jgi:soluble lytic murein transglycosylase
MAAYNAGPEAVSRWHQKYRNEEADVFVELIPYAQTNDYVKKVLLNYLSYRRLYPSDIL